MKNPNTQTAKEPDLKNAFWNIDLDTLFRILNSSVDGLTQADADKVLLSRGLHHSQKSSPLKKDVVLFLGQFKSPLMILLISAVILSAFLGDTSDVFIILFILLSTGIMSFLQERKAGKIVEKLKSMISLKSNVLRDGKAQEILTTLIVPGDVLILKAGDMIPADSMVIECNELHANESSLTGESFPVRKEHGTLPVETELSKRTNCLWMGTNIVSGGAKALVIHTGEMTVFGSITKNVSSSIETAFDKGIKDFGFFLMKITLVLALFIMVVNLVNHKNAIEAALFALALAVGMAPELLPAISSIAMSAGARRMLEKKVIVKKLSSIQNLGEVNLLCTDKTGTITEGSIKIMGLTDWEGKENSFIKNLSYWNAIYETGYSNPIDEALKQLTIDASEIPKKIGEIPYDFIRKKISIAVGLEKENLLISKGAFLEILNSCTKIRLADGLTEDIGIHKSELEIKFKNYSADGIRVLGICYKTITTQQISKELETEMIFGGFILMNDPIKSDIKETIDELNKLKVGLKIITGDNINIARSIGISIGIQDPVIMTGTELNITIPESLTQLVKNTHVFAEVEPQQKERIILALKKSFTVAYIGDGINDVSAINAADVGISVENAVDVAREAADFVLMEKALNVLVDGIREGRKTFSNTLKYIYINTGSTFGNMVSVAVASILLPFLPMLPKQILLTNFLTDFPFLSVASDNVDEEQLSKPGKWDLRQIRNYMIVFGIHSSIFDIITFLTLLFLLKTNESAFQTGWFVESVLSELFILFIIRTHKNFFKSRPARNLLILSLFALIITVSLPYLFFAQKIGLQPMPLINLGAMLIIVLLYIITADLLKVYFFKRQNGK